MSDTLDVLTAEFQNYVVAPLNAFGLGGFVFDIEGESTAQLSAEITDHYTEDNRALQDHIAIHPKRITLKGYVGEVVYTPSTGVAGILQKAVQKLTVIGSYLPQLSAAATQIQDAIDSSSPPAITLSQASNIYGLVKNIIASTGPEARQERAYNYFKALMNQGILMGIQTPWEFMTNMAIEHITAIQTEASKYITDFAITLKEIRIAQTISGAYTANLAGQQTGSSLSTLSNQGALNQYRAENGLSTPPVDIQLQGVAALQSPNPVPIGNVPGVDPTSSAAPIGPSAIANIPQLIKSPLFQQSGVGQ